MKPVQCTKQNWKSQMDVGWSRKIKYKYKRNLEQSRYKKVISSVET